MSSAVARGCEHVGAGDRVEVVPNFLADGAADVGLREPRPAFLPDGDFLLFVGELGGHKGADVLLKAHARLGADAPPLVLIGTPHPDFPPVESDNVIVVKDVPHAQVMRAWSEATVGVVPSVSPDACPTTAIEALATGTPVVGSIVGGLPEIVADGVTGLLGRPGDVDQLEANLRTLIDDPALAGADARGLARASRAVQRELRDPADRGCLPHGARARPRPAADGARDLVNSKPHYGIAPMARRPPRRVRSTALLSFALIAVMLIAAPIGLAYYLMKGDDKVPRPPLHVASVRMVNYYPRRPAGRTFGRASRRPPSSAT